MSWVEELKPEDEVKVEIIYPAAYVEHNLLTTSKFASAISLRCKAAAILEEDMTEFLIWDMTILQVYSIEDALKKYGIELTHESGKLPSGRRWTYFYADVTELQEKMKNGEM